MKAILVILTGVFVTATAWSAPAGADLARAVVPAQRRIDALKVAGKVLTVRHAGWREMVAQLPDPFFRTNLSPVAEERVATAEEPVRRSERSDLDVLKAVATQIQPDGVFIVGDDRYLLLRGKRIKVGDSLTVTFEGLIHHIVISSVEKNVYTLRLNEQELRREFQ